MTTVEVVQLCGARVRRCRDCENTLGAREDCCGKCKSTDVDEASTCRNRALAGRSRCRKHGGVSPQVRAKATSRAAEKEAEAMLLELLAEVDGSDVADDPGERLEVASRKATAIRDQLQAALGSMLSLTEWDAFSVERERVLFRLLGEWDDRAKRANETVLKLGLAARRQSLDEALLQGIVQAFDIVLSRVIPVELHALCKETYAAALEALDEGRQPDFGTLPPVPQLARPGVPSVAAAEPPEPVEMDDDRIETPADRSEPLSDELPVASSDGGPDRPSEETPRVEVVPAPNTVSAWNQPSPQELAKIKRGR